MKLYSTLSRSTPHLRRTSSVLTRLAVRTPVSLIHTQKFSAPISVGHFSPPVRQIPRIFARTYATDDIAVEVVPNMGDSISEGTVAKWSKNVGDSVKVDDLVVSLETDKITVDINAKYAGTIVETLANEGDVVQVGKEMFKIKKGAASEAPKKDAPKTDAPKPETTKDTAKIEAKTEAPKSETSKAEVPKEAAKTEAPKAEGTKPATPAPAPATKPAASTPSGPRERRVKMGPMRKKIAERLKFAQNTNAMLTTFQECDMSGISELRSTYQESFAKKHGVKLGFMSIFVKAAVAALKDQPSVNAVIDGDSIVYRDFYDLSVAVATPRGLVVPVIRDCDSKSFSDIEKELGVLGTKARNDQIAIEDMVGGTFTISNGGVYGSLMGTPIINPPQSAILGMHGINKRAVVVNDKIEIRPMMYLALTYDHRLIDGREAVTFLRKIKDIVEDPRRLLLDI